MTTDSTAPVSADRTSRFTPGTSYRVWVTRPHARRMTNPPRILSKQHPNVCSECFTKHTSLVWIHYYRVPRGRCYRYGPMNRRDSCSFRSINQRGISHPSCNLTICNVTGTIDWTAHSKSLPGTRTGMDTGGHVTRRCPPSVLVLLQLSERKKVVVGESYKKFRCSDRNNEACLLFTIDHSEKVRGIR